MKEIKPNVFRVIVDDSHCGKTLPCIECSCGCGHLLWKKSPAILFKGNLISISCAIDDKIIAREDILGKKKEDVVIIQTKSDFLSGKAPIGFGKTKKKEKEEKEKENVVDDIELWLSGGLLTKVSE